MRQPQPPRIGLLRSAGAGPPRWFHRHSPMYTYTHMYVCVCVCVCVCVYVCVCVCAARRGGMCRPHPRVLAVQRRDRRRRTQARSSSGHIMHGDWAHPVHICAGTGLTPAHICTGTWPTPPTSAPGLTGLTPPTSAPGLTGLTPAHPVRCRLAASGIAPLVVLGRRRGAELLGDADGYAEGGTDAKTSLRALSLRSRAEAVVATAARLARLCAPHAPHRTQGVL